MTKHQITRRIYHFMMVVCAAFTSFPSDSLFASEKEAFQEPTIEQAKAILREPEPETNDRVDLDRHFRNKLSAARALGDLLEQERIIRRWLDRSPNSMEQKSRLGVFLLRYSASYEEGLKLVEESLRAADSAKNMNIFGVNVRMTLIGEYARLGLFKQAETLSRQAEEKIQRFDSIGNYGDKPWFKALATGRFHRVVAELHIRKGNLEEALIYLQKSISYLEAALNLSPPRVVTNIPLSVKHNLQLAWISAAEIHRLRGDFYQAEIALKKALEAQPIKQQGDVLWGLETAALRFEQGLFKESERNARSLITTWRENKLAEVSAQFISAKASLNRSLAAQQKWDELLAEFKEIDSLTAESPSLAKLAQQLDIRWLAHYFAGDYAKASEVSQALLESSSNLFGPEHPTVALHKGFHAVALSRLDTQADRSRVRAMFEASLETLTNPKSFESRLRNDFDRFLLGLIFDSYVEELLRGGSPAEQDVRKAFSVLSLDQASSVQTAIQSAAIRAGITDPKLAEIIRVDQDHAQELESLYRLLATQEEGVRLQDSVIESLKSRILELNEKRQQSKREIEQRRPDFAQLMAPRKLQIEDIQKALGSDEAFLFIHPAADRLHTFGISQERFAYKSVALSSKDAADVVKRIRATLDVAGYGLRAPQFDAQASSSLYEALITPHLSVLGAKKQLAVSVSGPMAQIPFEVLLESNWSGKDYAQAPWLAKRFAVSYSASPSAWIATKALAQKRSGELPLLAWGDPAYRTDQSKKPAGEPVSATSTVRSVAITRNATIRDLTAPVIDVVTYENLPPLPETREEVLELAKVLEADPTKDLILGASATRQSVLDTSTSGDLAKRSVVVFATHGLIAGDLPNLNQPALAMASTPNPKDSPLLTLDDVLSLKLNADWVVLSACNTAAADGRAEEALSGLARGFFYAGSRSLLVTHWSVESQSATLLTTETFKAYKADPSLTRALALNKAMLTVMQNPSYQHPAFWAPYVLVGEGGR